MSAYLGYSGKTACHLCFAVASRRGGSGPLSRDRNAGDSQLGIMVALLQWSPGLLGITVAMSFVIIVLGC